jgi:hypothetical protein
MVDPAYQPDLAGMSFGPYLKELRRRKNISAESVAAELKISPAQVMWIEAEDHERLPDGIYVKGILKSYARYIGADERDILDRYMICRACCGAATCGLPVTVATGRSYKSRIWIFLRIPVILMVVSVVYMIHQTSVRPSSPMKKQIRNIPAVFLWETVRPGTNKTFSRLELAARSKTHVRLSVDDDEPVEWLLFPMDQIEMAVSRHVRLEMDNPDGLRIRWNGETIAVPGNNDEAVILELP